jgi:hypothetical protein
MMSLKNVSHMLSNDVYVSYSQWVCEVVRISASS